MAGFCLNQAPFLHRLSLSKGKFIWHGPLDLMGSGETRESVLWRFVTYCDVAWSHFETNKLRNNFCHGTRSSLKSLFTVQPRRSLLLNEPVFITVFTRAWLWECVHSQLNSPPGFLHDIYPQPLVTCPPICAVLWPVESFLEVFRSTFCRHFSFHRVCYSV